MTSGETSSAIVSLTRVTKDSAGKTGGGCLGARDARRKRVVSRCDMSRPIPPSAPAFNLFALTFIASALLFTTAILPSTRLVDISVYEPSTVPLGLFYATLALYLGSLVLAATTPCGPPLHFSPADIYSPKILEKISTTYEDNVCGIVGASVWDTLLFSYTTKVVMLGNTSESLEIGDLPIVPADLRATTIFKTMRSAVKRYRLRVRSWRPRPGSGIELAWQLLRVNSANLLTVVVMAMIVAVLFYSPHYFLQRVVHYLELDPQRENRGWGWVYCCGLFFSNALTQLSKWPSLSRRGRDC